MFTACNGSLGSQNIFGGYFVGKRPQVPVSVARQMNYKGEPSGPRMKQRTVVTEDIHGKSTPKVPLRLSGGK